jgi:glycosyltransferase involved in cell wall biosynthesis
MMASDKVSVILPVYNEGKVLRRNILDLERILARLFGDFEIIISEDGSTDGSFGIAKALESGRIRVFHNGSRQGKGVSIMHATEAARGDILVFMDADLASNPEHVRELVGLLRGGADIVIGSRYLKGSMTRRSPTRLVASKAFNWLVRGILGSRITDHQCGFKAFRKSRVLPVIGAIEDKRWFWDTEFLVRAQRNGLSIKEIPIEWKEAPESKFRLIDDTVHMAGSLIRFKLKNG